MLCKPLIESLHTDTHDKRSASKKSISGVDLFCGVGGLTYGLVRGGLSITAGVDVDEDCRYPYEANNNAIFLQKNIRKLSACDILPYFKTNTYHLLAGCAPCQPFSTYSQPARIKRSDAKWNLLLDFGRLIKEVQPDLVSMENVPQLIGHRVFHQFIQELKGYHLWYRVVECTRYGIPQTRKRLVLLASRLGPIELIAPTHSEGQVVTVREAIGKLPKIKAGQAAPFDNLHVASKLSSLNLKRIKASKPGGTWRDWPKDLRADCHIKSSGQSYPSVYGRMKWEKPAPTITTQCYGYGNGRFGHPEQNRAISLREAAIIQTFPIDYQFVEPGTRVEFRTLGRLIGNAVPVRLGEIVAASLLKHISNHG